VAINVRPTLNWLQTQPMNPCLLGRPTMNRNIIIWIMMMQLLKV
jgi:hypothetical protein